MVGAGQAVFLRRPRHDREPAGAGNVARKRTTGARHHRHRARCLRPDRRERQHPELEYAGGKDLRMAAPGRAREELHRTDHRRSRPQRSQGGSATLPAFRARPDPRKPPRNRGAAARRQGIHGRAERHRAAAPRGHSVQRILPRSHRQDRGGGPDSAVRKNGSRRSAHRRHRARFQQYPDGHHRNHRNSGRRGREGAATCGHHENDRRRRGTRRGPHPASSCVRPQAAAAAAGDRHQYADHRHRQAAAAHAWRAYRDRIGVRRRNLHGHRRPQSACDRNPQSCAQRPRRHARRRQAHPRNRLGLSSTKITQASTATFGPAATP